MSLIDTKFWILVSPTLPAPVAVLIPPPARRPVTQLCVLGNLLATLQSNLFDKMV